MRSLAAFAVLKQKDPAVEMKIEPIWLVALLNSLIWGDRHTAAVTLVTITEEPRSGDAGSHQGSRHAGSRRNGRLENARHMRCRPIS